MGNLAGRLIKELSWGRWKRTQKKPHRPKPMGWMRLKVGGANAHAKHGQQQYGQNLVAFHNGRAKNKCHAKRKDANQKHDECCG
jgi:hypothetical protein